MKVYHLTCTVDTAVNMLLNSTYLLHEVELCGGVSEVTLYMDERRMFRRTNRTKQGVGGRLQRRQDLHRCYLPLRCPLYDFFTATQLKHSSFVRFIPTTKNYIPGIRLLSPRLHKVPRKSCTAQLSSL